jgi:hypothetical protein
VCRSLDRRARLLIESRRGGGSRVGFDFVGWRAVLLRRRGVEEVEAETALNRVQALRVRLENVLK